MMSMSRISFLASWILFMFGASIVSVRTLPTHCSVDDLTPGLKYNGEKMAQNAFKIYKLVPVQCYDIYLNGNSTVRCRSNGQWSREYPPCQPILCKSPPSVKGGGLQMTGWRVGDKAIVICPEGTWYNGTNPRICQRNTSWTGESGHCQEVKCSQLAAPYHGTIKPPPPYKYQDRIQVLCREGFVYTGSSELVCQGNNMWEGKIGTCKEIASIRCNTELPVKAKMTPERKVGKFKDEIIISCPKGFTYNGTSRRTCQADGTWSGTPGHCNVKTCKPFDVEIENSTAWEAMENVMVLISHVITIKSTTPQTSDVFKYGDTIEVKCHPGYIYNGALLTCNEHGQWEGRRGLCTAVPCLEDPIISNGSINGSGFVYKDETNIECDRGYEWEGSSPHAVCRADGTWQINAQCVAVPCLDPPTITDAEFEDSGYVYGDEVNVICKSGHTWEGSTPHATCRHDGTWQVNGECRGLGIKDIVLAVVPSVIALLVIVLGLPISIRVFRQWSKTGKRVEDGENIRLMDSNEDRIDSEEEATPASVKKAIIDRGHVINRNPDKKINLDNQFVKLRVVTGEGYDRMDEINDALPDRYQDYLQRAGAENIEMEDILNHVKEETVDGVRKRKPLLMEGRAGVGKSTLVQKLMRLWAQNVWAKDYKAAFLFNIRNLTVHDKRQISLEDLFSFHSVYNTRDVTKDMLIRNEEKILLLIDGLDEFPGLSENLRDIDRFTSEDLAEPIEWCINLLRRDVLGKAVLIISSRPFKDLTHISCSPILEVVGLTGETVLDFIDHQVAIENVERVRNSMIKNPLVMSVSSITYFCLMFCMVLEEDENISIEELTTYTRITAFFIQHYMKRCESPQPRPALDDSRLLKPLTKLAYRGLIERYQMGNRVRLVFDEKDLEETGVTEQARMDSEQCGILVSTAVSLPHSQVSEKLQSSEFVHLSIQELLAMLELLQQSKSVIISAAERMWNSGSFLMAQQYIFGLCYDQKNKHINKLLLAVGHGVGPVKGQQKHCDLVTGLVNRLTADMKADSHTNSRLQAIQMAHETQHPDVAAKVAEVLFGASDVMSFQGTLLTAVDMNAIVFMLNMAHKECKLRMEKVMMDQTSEILLAENLSKCRKLRGFSLRGTKLSTVGARKLLHGLPRPELLSELWLDHVGLNAETEDDLAEVLQPMTNLTSLSLEGSHWTDAGMRLLGDVLMSKTTLNELCLANAELVDDNITQIIAALKHTSITKLSLNGNTLGGQGVLKLAAWLKTNPSLQHLNLANTGIGDDLVKILLTAFNTNYTLKTLDICGEKIEYNLPGLLMENTTLDALWYSDSKGDTRTVTPVAGTNRRMEVSAAPSGTQFIPWCLQDLITSSALLHPHAVWSERSSDLYLGLDGRYTDLYGAERPPVTTDTWCHTLNQLTSSTHRVGMLSVLLSVSASLSPFLSSLTHDMIHTLIHSQVGRVMVYYGEVTCSDLLTWLSCLSSQPGWSVSGRTNGARVTNTEGQSILIKLCQSRVVISNQQKQQYKAYLMTETGLLYNPEWIDSNPIHIYHS